MRKGSACSEFEDSRPEVPARCNVLRNYTDQGVVFSSRPVPSTSKTRFLFKGKALCLSQRFHAICLANTVVSIKNANSLTILTLFTVRLSLYSYSTDLEEKTPSPMYYY